jgi:hypothetical protein
LTPIPTDPPAAETPTPAATAAIDDETTARPDVTTDSVRSPAGQAVGSADLLAALAGILLTAVFGVLLWQPAYKTASHRTRLILVTFIAGMIGYLLYGIGWLRPDLWLASEVPIYLQRLMLAALVLIFGLIGNVLERRIRSEPGKRM